MKGRARDIDEAAVAELQANLSVYRKSLLVLGTINIFLLAFNFVFIGFFYAQYHEGSELTAEFRINKLRDNTVAAANQLKTVDQDFADVERTKMVTDTLSAAASPFRLLALEQQSQIDLIAAYLLQLKSLVDEAEGTSEWLYFQEQRLAPLVERAGARAKAFMSAAEQIQNTAVTRVKNSDK